MSGTRTSDNGPQYSNTRNLFDISHEFKQFAKEWGFQHVTSSPEYADSNGGAERAVQTAKIILKKAAGSKKEIDPFEALFKYRNKLFTNLRVCEGIIVCKFNVNFGLFNDPRSADGAKRRARVLIPPLRLFTPGETKALAKSKVHQLLRAWVTNDGWSSSLI